MYEILEKIKPFFKDEESYFAAKQVLIERETIFQEDIIYRLAGMMREAAFVLDENWHYLFINDIAKSSIKKTEDELRNFDVWTLFPEIRENEIGKAMLRARAEKKNIHLEQTQHIDGRWYDVMFIPLSNYLIVFSREISSHKKIQIGYDSILSKNNAILAAIPDSLYRIHVSGKALDYKKYPEVLEWDEELKSGDWEFLDMSELFPSSDLERIKKKINQVIDENELVTLEYFRDAYDGRKHYELRLSKSGPFEALAILRDISIRKKAEQLKNEFISVVSHELRTPLTSIKGAIDLLVGGVAGELNNQAKSLLNICKKNTLRLVRFVTDLLDIESLDSGNINFDYRTHKLADIVSHAIESMRTFSAQFHVEIDFVNPDPNYLVFVDEDRLHQCITNLISNAVKYTPKHSNVTVELGLVESNVFLKITDKGPGIDPDVRLRLFHRFVQGPPPKDKLVGGSGLGLPITKAFVEQMLGKIYYESSESGTSFFIELPRVTNRQEISGNQ